MSDQITLLEITDIGKEGIGFKFHGLKHFNDKWFSWAAISKAILHREDEIIIDQKCTMPNYKQLQSQVEQLQAENARLRKALLKIHNNGATWAGQTMAREALASTDSSNWLAEQKAQWRREELSRDVLWQIDRKAFIKIMVDKFLCWKLPEHFRPDAGISFTPEYNVEYMAAQGKPPCRHEPVGTNLFSADQAEQMFDDCFPDTVEVNERRMAEQGEPK